MGHIFGTVYVAVIAAAIFVEWWLIATFFLVLLVHLFFKAKENDRAREEREQKAAKK
jgi:hypothetical protein